MFKSGFVSIVGRPNVGKSTLMNNVVGEKIAIMSDKPQTTRNTIQAVYTDEDCQIVFLDTPGIHKPKNKLGEFMVKSATDAFKNVDLVLFVVDDSKKIGPGDTFEGMLDKLHSNYLNSYSEAHVVEGAKEVVGELYKENNLFFVTARNSTLEEITMDWV